MHWLGLQSIDEFQQVLEDSYHQPVAVFKHSTRCSTSSVSKNRLEREVYLFGNKIKFYLLDVIASREVSNKVASDLQVTHESPQLIVIKEGKTVYDASHLSIAAKELLKFL